MSNIKMNTPEVILKFRTYIHKKAMRWLILMRLFYHICVEFSAFFVFFGQSPSSRGPQGRRRNCRKNFQICRLTTVYQCAMMYG